MWTLTLLRGSQGLMTILMHTMFGNKLYTASSNPTKPLNIDGHGHAMLLHNLYEPC